jgi:long-chain acyl-CoA synthetase
MATNIESKGMTLVDMLERNIKHFPQKSAIISEQGIINYEELGRLSNKLANRLIAEGLKKGNRVGLLLKKTPEAIISFLGIVKAGGVVVPLNFKLSLDQLSSLIQLINPHFLFIDRSFVAFLDNLKLKSYISKSIVVGGKKNIGRSFSWEDFLSDSSPEEPEVIIKEHDLVYLNFTSGSTGYPKGALTTHANIFWNTISAIEALRLTPEDIHLCMFPIFVHPHEIFARPLLLGGPMVLTDTVYPKKLAQIIEDNGVTCMMAIPPLYQTLLSLPRSYTFKLDSLRLPESGGMVTPFSLISGFKKRFDRWITPVWGSTETTGIAIACSPEQKPKPGSIGKPCPYYEIRIIDEERNLVNPNIVGQLIIKGPGVVSGYFEQKHGAQQGEGDIWLHTEDLVKQDREGYIYFVARKNEMMKVAGLKVFPLEIEEVLKSFPKIEEAAVISTQDNLHGEIPKAFIVVKPGEYLSAKEVKDYCRKYLANYKIPRVIEFREELPRTASGKIAKSSLS